MRYIHTMFFALALEYPRDEERVMACNDRVSKGEEDGTIVPNTGIETINRRI
jgi:hypothetical protein